MNMKIAHAGMCCALFLTGVSTLTLLGCGGTAAGDPPTVTLASTQNPLVAQYSVTSACVGQAMAEFGPDTSYGRSTAWYPAPGHNSSMNFFVAGMRASTTYHMRVVFNCFGKIWNGPDQTFATGPLPSTPFPKFTVTHNANITPGENPGVELVDLIDNSGKTHLMQTLFTDRDGVPIWYYDIGVASGNYPYTMKPLSNGNIIFNISNLNGGTSFLREVDLAGNTIRELKSSDLEQSLLTKGVKFPGVTFHHDLLELPNGHLMALVLFTKDYSDLPGYPGNTAVVGDGLVELDENWNVVWTWSAFDYLDVNRHLNGLPDWTHSNAVIYSPTDGNVILSMRHQAWLLKIDYQNGAGTGNLLWRLGNGGDFAINGGNPADWFYFQHFPTILSQSGTEDTLAIWDNGNDRDLDDSGTQCGVGTAPGCYSRATIFQIDESTRTANLLWQDEPGYFSFWGGSIDQLGNGNVEFDMTAPIGPVPPGVVSEVMEVTQTPIPQTVWQMNISGTNAYRAYRVPSLYPGVSWDY